MFQDILAVLLSIAQSQSATTCPVAEITEPVPRSIVAQVRPVISWRAIPEASRYRVQIESGVPEGRVLVSLDTQVGATTFQVPQPLTDLRAAVKVRVTTGCPADDGSQLRAQSASFFIDTAALCPGPARIEMSATVRGIVWAPTPNASRYDVTFLRPDGAHVAKGQTQRAEFALPADNSPLIAVVRPYCATGFGSYGSALIPVAQR